MAEKPRRTEKISTVLPPELARQLDAYAAEHRWSRSTAVLTLIEMGLRREQEDKGKDADQEAK